MIKIRFIKNTILEIHSMDRNSVETEHIPIAVGQIIQAEGCNFNEEGNAAIIFNNNNIALNVPKDYIEVFDGSGKGRPDPSPTCCKGKKNKE